MKNLRALLALSALGVLSNSFAVAPARADAWEDMMKPLAHLGAGRIGVDVQAMTPELREYFGAPGDRGVLVAEVEKDGPADAAGVRVGDVIVAARGEAVRAPMDLARVVGATDAGAGIDLTVVRERSEVALTAHPRGEKIPWLDPQGLAEQMRRGLLDGAIEGSDELQRQLDSLRERLEKLEREFREERQPRDDGKQAT